MKEEKVVHEEGGRGEAREAASAVAIERSRAVGRAA